MSFLFSIDANSNLFFNFLFSVHRSSGELSQGPDRGREGAEEKVRKADRQVLCQSRKISGTVNKETGHRLARGKIAFKFDFSGLKIQKLKRS